ncbi:MAG TPA: hypothetical protein VGZ72_15720 [Stellaceae bacterium]|jgi:hypothetical protein|nr:hypothetical protein [Stellaceae bacterium]
MKKMMAQGIGAAVLAATLMVAPALLGPASFTAARAACEPGDRIDNTTADMAKKRAESAGYSQVRMERKGCDNVWHGFGMKGGTAVRVAVSPSGEVMPEGD